METANEHKWTRIKNSRGFPLHRFAFISVHSRFSHFASAAPTTLSIEPNPHL